MKVKIDPFLVAIIGATGLAYFFPEWGSEQSPVPIDRISAIGVSFIFFFYGLKLSPEKIKTGLKNWKLHLLVQLSVFLVFPLTVLAVYPFISGEKQLEFWLAFLFMAALPSTVSSSVLMVSIARGNIPAAIFNASISGLIGIVITPLWMGPFIQNTSGNYDLSDVYVKLLTEILAPVVFGLLLQRFLGKFARDNARWLTLFDKTIILLIIYKSFAHSFEEQVFSSVKLEDLAIITVLAICLFFFMYAITGFFSRWLKFNLEDQITARFCGTKKSLVHGTVFSKILFPASFSTGIILLPLMLFHAFQIFIVSIFASELAKRKPE